MGTAGERMWMAIALTCLVLLVLAAIAGVLTYRRLETNLRDQLEYARAQAMMSRELAEHDRARERAALDEERLAREAAQQDRDEALSQLDELRHKLDRLRADDEVRRENVRP